MFQLKIMHVWILNNYETLTDKLCDLSVYASNLYFLACWFILIVRRNAKVPQLKKINEPSSPFTWSEAKQITPLIFLLLKLITSLQAGKRWAMRSAAFFISLIYMMERRLQPQLAPLQSEHLSSSCERGCFCSIKFKWNFTNVFTHYLWRVFFSSRLRKRLHS